MSSISMLKALGFSNTSSTQKSNAVSKEKEEQREKEQGVKSPNRDTVEFSANARVLINSMVEAEASAVAEVSGETTDPVAVADYEEVAEEVQVDGDELDVDGDELDVDGDELDIEGDETVVELDGDELDVEAEDTEVDGTEDTTKSEVERVHGYARSLSEADLLSMKYAMMSIQASAFSSETSSLFDYLSSSSGNSNWFEDTGATDSSTLTDLLDSLNNWTSGNTDVDTDTEVDDVETDVETDVDTEGETDVDASDVDSGSEEE